MVNSGIQTKRMRICLKSTNSILINNPINIGNKTSANSKKGYTNGNELKTDSLKDRLSCKVLYFNFLTNYIIAKHVIMDKV